MALHHFHERVDESPRQDKNFEPSGAPVAFFVSEIWPFEVDFPARSNSTYLSSVQVPCTRPDIQRA